MEAAAGGLCALLVERPPDAAAPEHRFSCEAPDLRSLVIAVLNELIAVSSAGVVTGCCSAAVRRTPAGYDADVTCHVEEYRRCKHGDIREIKAATYHTLNMHEEKSGAAYAVDVLLDL